MISSQPQNQKNHNFGETLRLFLHLPLSRAVWWFVSFPKSRRINSEGTLLTTSRSLCSSPRFLFTLWPRVPVGSQQSSQSTTNPEFHKLNRLRIGFHAQLSMENGHEPRARTLIPDQWFGISVLRRGAWLELWRSTFIDVLRETCRRPTQRQR